MHPVITQAIAAERAREFRAFADSAGRARQLSRSAPARLLRRFPRGGPGLAFAGSGPAGASPGVSLSLAMANSPSTKNW
jgi:hypothetical protein